MREMEACANSSRLKSILIQKLPFLTVQRNVAGAPLSLLSGCDPPPSPCAPRAAQRCSVAGAAQAAGQIKESIWLRCSPHTLGSPSSPVQGMFGYSTPDYRGSLFLPDIILAPCLWQGLTGWPLTPWHPFVCFPKYAMKTALLWSLTNSSTLNSLSQTDHCCHAVFSGDIQESSLSQPRSG